MTTNSQTHEHMWLSFLLVIHQPVMASVLTLTNNTAQKLGILTESNAGMQKNILAPGEKRMLFGESHIQVNSMYYETGWENAAEWLDFCYLESNSTPTQVSTIRSDHEAEAYVYFYTVINLDLDVGPQVNCNIFYNPVEEYSHEESDEA